MRWRSVLVPAISWRAASHVMFRTSSCRKSCRPNESPRRECERGRRHATCRKFQTSRIASGGRVVRHAGQSVRPQPNVAHVIRRAARDTAIGACPPTNAARSSVGTTAACGNARDAIPQASVTVAQAWGVSPCLHGRRVAEWKRCFHETASGALSEAVSRGQSVSRMQACANRCASARKGRRRRDAGDRLLPGPCRRLIRR